MLRELENDVTDLQARLKDLAVSRGLRAAADAAAQAREDLLGRRARLEAELAEVARDLEAVETALAAALREGMAELDIPAVPRAVPKKSAAGRRGRAPVMVDLLLSELAAGRSSTESLREAAVARGLSANSVSACLRTLHRAGRVKNVRRGQWALADGTAAKKPGKSKGKE